MWLGVKKKHVNSGGATQGLFVQRKLLCVNTIQSTSLCTPLQLTETVDDGFEHLTETGQLFPSLEASGYISNHPLTSAQGPCTVVFYFHFYYDLKHDFSRTIE